MAAEIARLPETSVLLASGEFRVIEAGAADIPLTLKEIGRLRELTFRSVGEGTGKACDLDAFDRSYRHLFLWNAVRCEVAGAYRVGRTDELVAGAGPRGLYTSTLFVLKRRFLDRIGPALEMGRSFVRPEYQKSYSPLLLLWKGLARMVVRDPRYRMLFGPVSISNSYKNASRRLMASYFEGAATSPGLARLVRPKTPLRGQHWLARAARTLVHDLDDLLTIIDDIEADTKGIPVLLRQYLKLGGKILAFNVDRDFADTLDGLIVVDLLAADPRQLERYMLTARGEEVDRIVGLELGADDYVVKPFSPRELILRLRAVLKRHSPEQEKRQILTRDALTVDLGAHRVLLDGEEVALTATEFRLLVELFQSTGRVLTRDRLLNAVWGYEFEGYARTVDTHAGPALRRLRPGPVPGSGHRNPDRRRTRRGGRLGRQPPGNGPAPGQVAGPVTGGSVGKRAALTCLAVLAWTAVALAASPAKVPEFRGIPFGTRLTALPEMEPVARYGDVTFTRRPEEKPLLGDQCRTDVRYAFSRGALFFVRMASNTRKLSSPAALWLRTMRLRP